MDKPKLIEELEPIPYYYKKKGWNMKFRVGLFQCPYCNKIFKCRFGNINSKRQKSCGCYLKTHHHPPVNKTHNMSKTRLYRIWLGMISRCYNHKHKAYNDYAGRGIIVCDEWKNDLLSFINWSLQNGYEEGLVLDRTNNDGNYEPSNCMWVTECHSSQNKRLIQKNNTSGYRGVTRNKKAKSWSVYITNNNERHHRSGFRDPRDAAIWYNNFVIEHKTFHPLNII